MTRGESAIGNEQLAGVEEILHRGVFCMKGSLVFYRR